MHRITTLDALSTLYDAEPGEASLRKVAPHLTPLYRKWIMASRFCILSTVGLEGTDVSPRGDDGPIVTELDPATLAMPLWRGNNRLDSLRNIVTDGRDLHPMRPDDYTGRAVGGSGRSPRTAASRRDP